MRWEVGFEDGIFGFCFVKRLITSTLTQPTFHQKKDQINCRVIKMKQDWLKVQYPKRRADVSSAWWQKELGLYSRVTSVWRSHTPLTPHLKQQKSISVITMFCSPTSISPYILLKTVTLDHFPSMFVTSFCPNERVWIMSNSVVSSDKCVQMTAEL